MTDRLRDLATQKAKKNHAQDAGHKRPKFHDSTREQRLIAFETCPHPDCVLVREAATEPPTYDERRDQAPTDEDVLDFLVAYYGFPSRAVMQSQKYESWHADIRDEVKLIQSWATLKPPTDDERVPATPRQVMAYRQVVTPVRAAPRQLAYDDALSVLSATGVDLIAGERVRQMDVEGWTNEHDDRHSDGTLTAAACCYAALARRQADGTLQAGVSDVPPPGGWPWDEEWWKPNTDLIRNLVKAGALISAEIDRLLRLRGPAVAQTPRVEAVTRLEVIDEAGRQFTRWGCGIQLSYQDQSRTLKVFVHDNPAASKRPESGWLEPTLRAACPLVERDARALLALENERMSDFPRVEARRDQPTCGEHGPMRLIFAQHRCDICGSFDEVAAHGAAHPQEPTP